jgi:glycerophosphoryl diester phosphodiesterase
MCGTAGIVEEMTLKELKALKLNGSEHTIPTLKECLETVNGSVPLLIEFKSWNGNSKKLCQAANEILRHYDGKYWIQSFYPQVLHWYKKHNKHVFRGQLATKFSKMGFEKTLLGWMLFNFLGRPHFISYENTHGKALMFRFVLWLGASSAGWTYRSEKHLKETKTSFQAWIFEEFLPKS